MKKPKRITEAKLRAVTIMRRRWEGDQARIVRLFGDIDTDEASCGESNEMLRNLATAIEFAIMLEGMQP